MLKTLAPLLVIGVIVSCAKDKSYDEVEKTADLEFATALQSKQALLDMCTVADPCLYMPSVANTPYNITASRPFWQGDQRIVVADLNSKGKLQYLQVEKDSRFANNINNLSPVLNVEVEHVDYKCSEDDFGDCTNKEEEDSDKNWKNRRYVKIQDIKVVETNTLPIEMANLYDAGCYSETDQTITKMDIEKNAINIVVKKSYKTNGPCLAEVSDLRYINFTVDYAYSIVKLSSITDSNYEPIIYPKADERKFGFFTTNLIEKTVDNHEHFVGSRKTIANRWSPNKKEVVYKLSEGFYEPELKHVLNSTKAAINTINNSLTKANANLQIKLEKGDDSKIGDLRENFIILVTDPQASGVIGYGPSASNPNTGEILNARTVMYYGTIQKFVSRAYDELVDEAIAIERGRQAEAAASESTQNGNTTANQMSTLVSAANEKTKNSFSRNLVSKFSLEGINSMANGNEQDISGYHFDPRNRDAKNRLAEDNSEIYKNLKTGIKSNKNKFETMISKLAEENFYHASQVDFSAAVLNALTEELKAGTLKYWTGLSEAKRKEMMGKLLPYVWVPTLVHEFGHNLGLRHNFYGSTDTANFYSKEESNALGMRKAVTYSSIMDYAPKTNNELSVMGKYDIGALKFAYAGQVETTTGENVDYVKVGKVYNSAVDEQITNAQVGLATATTEESISIQTEVKNLETQKLPNNLSTYTAIANGSAPNAVAALKAKVSINGTGDKILKSFKYCSDEHVWNDALCNRHDEGTTYSEVVDYHINQYKKNYEKRNFRGRRYSFESRTGDRGYFGRISGTFNAVYKFFTIFDQVASGGAYDDPKWVENKFLVDIKNASDKAFDFYMGVLETPAYHCVELDKEKGGVTRIAPFVEMAKGTKLEEQFGIDFDIRFGCLFLNQYGDQTKTYGEFGKYFNNALDYTLPNRELIMQGDSSQIDVRGMWLDKVLASMYVGMKITTPSTTGAAPGGNFFKYPEYNKRLKSTFNGFLTNQMVGEVDVTLSGGRKVKATLPYGFESSHKVNKSFDYAINRFAGLYDTKTNLNSILLKFLKREFMSDGDEGNIDSDVTLASYYAFDVTRVNPRINLADLNYDEKVVFRNSLGVVNYKFGVYKHNTKGMELAKIKTDIDTLDILEKSTVEIAFNVMVDDKLTIDILKASGEFSDQEIGDIEGAMEVGVDTLSGYISGTMNNQVLLSSFLALSK